MLLRDFRRLFWQPPRAHGDVIEDRTVSFLELFYDLVYVVTIAFAAATLARDIGWRSVGEFVVVFGLIWLAWFNGTVSYDLHGREDIRTRVFTFAQMLLVVLLAVFVGDAAGDSGRSFALVYSAFVALLTWHWYVVRRQDDVLFTHMTRRYLTLMVTAVVVMAASALLSSDARLMVWSALLLTWLTTLVVLGRGAERLTDRSIIVSKSTVERYGLFVIIVLGEVVFGVAEGLREAERDLTIMATGLIGLVIGFGVWWNYFDLTGRRLPREDPTGSPFWMVGHFPLTLSIAAAGAAMVSVIEHAGEAEAPAATAWLLTSSTAIGFVSLALIIWTLRDYDQIPRVYHPTALAILVGAGLAAALGALRLAPPALVISLAAIQLAVWIFAIWRRLVAHEVRPFPTTDGR